MSAITEFFEVLRTRIKAPIFGYFVFVYIAINWKPLFYLIFSDTSALDRITYFESSTDYLGQIIYPGVLSVLLTIGSPWLTAYFLKLCSQPTNWKNEIQVENEHKMAMEKLKREQERRNFQASLEQQVIELAKRDEAIEDIEDEKTKAAVRSEIDNIREKLSSVDHLETQYIENIKLSDLLTRPLNKENLNLYSIKKFPDREPKHSLELLILNDLDREKYRVIADIDHAVGEAELFLVEYKRDRPDMFRYSTDFITKALGLIDASFREKHNFSQETLHAMSEYEYSSVGVNA